MATKFEPLSLATVDQGIFMIEAQTEFRKLQDAFIRHVRAHGTECAGKLKLEVKLEHKKGAVFITTDISTSPPRLPKTITNALIDAHSDGSEELCLFTAVGGSSTDPPQQMQICTRTGEIIEIGRAHV